MGDVSNKGLAWIAALALFMQALDATILNTALPAISDSLKESPLDMQMAIISYALTVAALIPLSGWLADKFGTLRVFRSAILFICIRIRRLCVVLVVKQLSSGSYRTRCRRSINDAGCSFDDYS